MVVIRAVFDGKVARPLPGEPVPEITGEVEAQIVLPERENAQAEDPVQGLFRIRQQTPPLPFPVSELVQASCGDAARYNTSRCKLQQGG
jgi:hypothetical protein